MTREFSGRQQITLKMWKFSVDNDRTYIPHPVDTKISNFFSPILTGARRMSKIMLGDLQNPQKGLLNGREGVRQVTLLAHAEDDYTLELPGHHVGGWVFR
jgi:hypothetical protein